MSLLKICKLYKSIENGIFVLPIDIEPHDHFLYSQSKILKIHS